MAHSFLNNNSNNPRFIIVPCPHEKTTSYGKGTKTGPAAILYASKYLESFDHEIGIDPAGKSGIQTSMPSSYPHLAPRVSGILQDKKVPIILGGEHSISVEAIRAAKEFFPDLSVIQFDAHADLRDSYNGDKNSHACVMRRVLEICPAVQVGVRSISEEEWHFANSFCQINKIHFRDSTLDIRKILDQLSNNVYITFDVDVLDPSIMPSTGTPEPGGLLWDDILKIIKAICEKKNIVAMDFVELAPIKGLNAPDFTIAKLIYKTIGYLSNK